MEWNTYILGYRVSETSLGSVPQLHGERGGRLLSLHLIRHVIYSLYDLCICLLFYCKQDRISYVTRWDLIHV